MKQLAKSVGAIAAVCGLAAGVHSVAAHHSTAMFDHSKIVTINGTVVELRWVNPHVSLSVNGSIKEADAPTLWLMETTSPGNLVRRGWSRTVLKPGDRVQVDMNPLREGDKKGGALTKVTLVDTGQVFTANIRDETAGQE
jgi:hypothetical protein